MAASSFSIWWKFDEIKNSSSDIINYNRDGQRISLRANGSPSLLTLTAGTKHISVTHQFDSEQEFRDWHHYVFTQEDNGRIALYVDGRLSIDVDNPHVNGEVDSLGDVAEIGDTVMDGRFDDFRSFKRVINFREAEYLYNGGELGGRNELALGLAPIDVPLGIDSASECSDVNLGVDLRVDSVESASEVIDALFKTPCDSDSVQSESQVAEVDCSVRKFDLDADPLIVGDRMSSSLERAVLEFNIERVSVVSNVLLCLTIEDVNEVPFVADVRRWVADFPSNKQELERYSVVDSGLVGFIPEVGYVELDVTQQIADAKSEGSSVVRIALMDRPNGTNQYYQVDNGPTPPRLKFREIVGISIDSAESNPQASEFKLPHKIESQSLEIVSEVTDASLFSPSLDDLTSAQSQAECFDVRIKRSTFIDVDSNESAAGVSDVGIRTGFFAFGDKLSFDGSIGPKPADEYPLFGNYLPYTPDLPSLLYDTQNEDSPEALIPVRIPDEGRFTCEFSGWANDNRYNRPDDTVAYILANGIVVHEVIPSANGSVFANDHFAPQEFSIPAGEYILNIVFPTAQGVFGSDPPQIKANIKNASLVRAPVVIDSSQSQPECSEANIKPNANSDDVQSNAQCQQVNLGFAGVYEEGSFESGLDDWSLGQAGQFGGSAWERGDWANLQLYANYDGGPLAHDGVYSLRADIDSAFGASGEFIEYNINTHAQGLTEFRGHIMLSTAVMPVRNWSGFAGVEILNGDDEVLLTIAGNNSPVDEWVDFTLEIPVSETSDSVDDYIIKIAMIGNRGMRDAYVYFDDFSFRTINHRLSAVGSQSSAVNQNVILGITGIGGTSDDVQSQAEVSSMYIKVPATSDSVESQAQASQVAVSRSIDILVDSAVAAAEAHALALSGDSVLAVDSAQSSMELRKFNLAISPPDLESHSFVEELNLGVEFDIDIDSGQSISEASGLAVSGNSNLLVDSLSAQSEASQVTAGISYPLVVESAESASQASSIAVQTVILVNPDDVKLCTPTEDSEDVVTGLAGEDISKGEVVRITGDDTYVLASTLTQEDSVYDGIAVTNAEAGDPVVVAVSGTVILGDVLRPNQLFALSARPGRMKHASEISSGEFLSVVGLAKSGESLMIGNDFRGVLLTNATEESVSGLHVEPVDAKLKVEVTVPTASRSPASSVIAIGDLINRSGSLADNSTITSSAFIGMAVTAGEENCTYAFVPSGANVDVGGELLIPNKIYVVGRRQGKMMAADELLDGEYCTVVGLAVGSRNIVLGSVAKGTLAV